jgi:hypothetical protein
MNEFLPPQFGERVDRLLLGIEPLDALRAARIAQPIEVLLDGAPAARTLTAIPRHSSCRHALLFKPKPLLGSPIVIRMVDRRRRFVPRRISYPVPADIHTPAPRVRRPALFPGAAYDVSETCTGMRGRVTWNRSTIDEAPARWVRVEARINGLLVGRAHGDDRGEFLLLLDSAAGGLGDLPAPLTAEVTVFGPAAPGKVSADDPLGDLPVEELLGEPDDVSPGEKLPPEYTSSSSRAVTFRLGALLTHQDKFFFKQ